MPPALDNDVTWLRALARTLADPAEADDLAQDAWVAALTRRPDGDRSLRPWLRTVLLNGWRMRRRSAGRRQAKRWRLSEDTAATPLLDEALHDHEVLAGLREGLATLRDDDRLIIEQRLVEGRETKQVAEQLAITPEAVRSRLKRALQRLRGDLDRRYGGRHAWVGAVALGRGGQGLLPLGKAMGVGAMTAMTKTIVITAMGGVAALAWLLWPASSEGEPSTAEAMQDGEGAVAHAADPDAAVSGDRAGWQRRLRAIRAARAKRDAAKDRYGVPRIPVPAVVPTYAQRARLSQRLFEETYHTIAQCLSDVAPDRSGVLEFSVRILGEPDIGGVIEDVAVTSDSTDDPELRACLVEGTPAFDLSDLEISVEQQLRFTADLSERSLGFLTDIPIDDVEAYVQARAQRLELDPAAVERLRRELHDQDPPISTEGYKVVFGEDDG